MADEVYISQELIELGVRDTAEEVRISQGLVELAEHITEQKILVSQILIEVAIVSTGRVRGPAVQFV